MIGMISALRSLNYSHQDCPPILTIMGVTTEPDRFISNPLAYSQVSQEVSWTHHSTVIR